MERSANKIKNFLNKIIKKKEEKMIITKKYVVIENGVEIIQKIEIDYLDYLRKNKKQLIATYNITKDESFVKEKLKNTKFKTFDEIC